MVANLCTSKCLYPTLTVPYLTHKNIVEGYKTTCKIVTPPLNVKADDPFVSKKTAVPDSGRTLLTFCVILK